MTFSTLLVSLGYWPTVRYGFWLSRGTGLPEGPMVTVSLFVFKYINTGFGLFIAWTLSRIVQIIEFLVFRHIFGKTTECLAHSQCAALVVNTKAPLEVSLTTLGLLRDGGPKRTLLRILLVALFLMALAAGIPALVAAFPTYEQGISASYLCQIFGVSTEGYVPLNPNDDVGQGYAISAQLIADAALGLADWGTGALPSSQSKKLSQALPVPNISHTFQCPSGAQCHPSFPFDFTSDYTLSAGDFGFNIDMQFSLQVVDTCYRPIDAIAPGDSGDIPVPYGLYYGPVTGDIDRSPASAELPNATQTFYEEQIYAGSYELTQQAARAGDWIANSWTPNSTLLLGGDTTILFYLVGGVLMTEQSSDPIYATGSLVSDLGPTGQLYSSSSIVSPIVCDTKYQFCANNDCSTFGGVSTLHSYLGTKSGEIWEDLDTFLSNTLFYPPIYMASIGSGAVFASLTERDGIQTLPEVANATYELSELVYTGQLIIASQPQLIAAGYWNFNEQGYSPPNATLPTLCGNVIVDNQGAVTIYLIPYIVFLVVAIPTIIASYVGMRVFKKKGYTDAWNLYTAGHLHRALVEEVSGRKEQVDITKNWPALRQGDLGLGIVDEDGVKRLGAPFFLNYPQHRYLTCVPQPLLFRPQIPKRRKT
jgi:hypothetical protein